MAIYHFSGQAFNRGDGRSSVAAACYRAAERILDFRTGEIHDYTRKSEVEETAIFIPGGATMTRSVLWNAVEAKHKRSDAVVARELEISLPIELSKAERKKLAFAYAQELAEKYRIAVDVCILSLIHISEPTRPY